MPPSHSHGPRTEWRRSNFSLRRLQIFQEFIDKPDKSSTYKNMFLGIFNIKYLILNHGDISDILQTEVSVYGPTSTISAA